MKPSPIPATGLASIVATGSVFANLIKPVGVTTTITGDAGSSHLHLLDDNAGQVPPTPE